MSKEITKAVKVKALEITDQDLEKINKYTLSPLTAEDVFVFKAVIADNGEDDRNYEPFTLNALKDMQKLYIGKTMLKDHQCNSDNQIARIFDTELVKDGKNVELIAKIYMPISESTSGIIAEIKAGIKKEVSTGFATDKLICNICGTNNTESYCQHYHGHKYTVNGEEKVCKMMIDGVTDAYELSFVAVPAQPRAGTTKNKENVDKAKEIMLKIRIAKAESKIEKENEIYEQKDERDFCSDRSKD